MLNRNSKSIIPFLMAGYPDLETSERFATVLIQEGIELIEIGVPFSDPLADGPVIQRASAAALAQGTKLADVLEMIQRLKHKHPMVSFVLFTYLNPILKFGLEKYVNEAVRVGISATLTVDLPPEEADEYLRLHKLFNLKTVFLVSPTTSAERIELISKSSTGFIYYVSRTGVTGTQVNVSGSLIEEFGKIRKLSDKAIAVGFGVSTPEQVLEVSKCADAVVIGSRLLQLIGQSDTFETAEKELRNFVRDSYTLLAR